MFQLELVYHSGSLTLDHGGVLHIFKKITAIAVIHTHVIVVHVHHLDMVQIVVHADQRQRMVIVQFVDQIPVQQLLLAIIVIHTLAMFARLMEAVEDVCLGTMTHAIRHVQAQQQHVLQIVHKFMAKLDPHAILARTWMDTKPVIVAHVIKHAAQMDIF